MLGNCEKIMTAISSTTSEWQQENQILPDDRKSSMASSSENKVMEKTNQDHPHQKQPLKCPRCESSNTKFCYYNNYSLSQPRHFCKACKRYWTRGGTLRNVPVGGGCRKNKRQKKQSGGDGKSCAASTTTANPSVQPQTDLSPASIRIHNPLFYSVPTNPVELNFPFSSFRVSSENTGFDLHPQMSNLGIGFSSGLVTTGVMNNDYKSGFKPILDHVISASNSSPFSTASNNSSLFFGSSSFCSTSTMPSLLASTLQQQKFDTMKDVQEANNGISGLMPYADLQMQGGNGVNMNKEVKIECGNRSVWNPNPVEQINPADSSSLLWNTTNLGAWFDPSNMGTSVPSLI